MEEIRHPCTVPHTAILLHLGSDGSQYCLPHHRLPLQGGGLYSQLQQALEAVTHNSRAVVLSIVTHVKCLSFCTCTVVPTSNGNYCQPWSGLRVQFLLNLLMYGSRAFSPWSVSRKFGEVSLDLESESDNSKVAPFRFSWSLSSQLCSGFQGEHTSRT